MQTKPCTTPIVDFVEGYRQSGFSRLHMPAHKGASFLSCEPWDITEIRGADELYEAEGIIAESEANATRLFGTAQTFYSTEGSSQCIRAMLYLALQGWKQLHSNTSANITARPVVVAARNAHKAFLYACALLDVEVQWLWAETTDSLCSCRITPNQVESALDKLKKKNIKPFGVYLTSPDYLGNMQDVGGIARACQCYGVPLLIDNAHGAYLAFAKPSGKVAHPIALGAAMCCDSAHKTLPVLTGGAYLHLGENAPIKTRAIVENALCLFGSTSPSYLILQSLDLCNRALSTDFPARLAQSVHSLTELKGRLCTLCDSIVYPTDEPLKLVLDGYAVGRTGDALAEVLRVHRVECEYADNRFVVLMPSTETTEQDLNRVFDAIQDAVTHQPPKATLSLQNGDEATLFAALECSIVKRCTIREAVFAPQEYIAARDAVGRVCALPAVSCPPAIPIAVSGEGITPEAVALFEHYGIESLAVIAEKA